MDYSLPETIASGKSVERIAREGSVRAVLEAEVAGRTARPTGSTLQQALAVREDLVSVDSLV